MCHKLFYLLPTGASLLLVFYHQNQPLKDQTSSELWFTSGSVSPDQTISWVLTRLSTVWTQPECDWVQCFCSGSSAFWEQRIQDLIRFEWSSEVRGLTSRGQQHLNAGWAASSTSASERPDVFTVSVGLGAAPHWNVWETWKLHFYWVYVCVSSCDKNSSSSSSSAPQTAVLLDFTLRNVKLRIYSHIEKPRLGLH